MSHEIVSDENDCVTLIITDSFRDSAVVFINKAVKHVIVSDLSNNRTGVLLADEDLREILRLLAQTSTT